MRSMIHDIGGAAFCVIGLLVGWPAVGAAATVATTAPAAMVRILSPSGSPAAGALVVIVPSGHQVEILGPRQVDDDPGYRTSTANADGMAAIAPVVESDRCVVLDDSGIAQLEAAAVKPGAAIQLKPWARIEGVVAIGGKPLPRVEVQAMQSPQAPEGQSLFNDSLALTDRNGHFELDRVPPGKTVVGLIVNWTAGQSSSSQLTYLRVADVKPGATTHVAIGGDGRRVIGRLILPPRMVQNHNWAFFTCTAYASLEGSMEQVYPVKVAEDGAFHIADVEPGAYRLYFRAISNGDDDYQPGSMLLRTVSDFTMPADSAGSGEAPLQLADIPTQLLPPPPHVGSMAPPLALRTLAGQPIALEQQRGRWVLMDFWATWCGPCIGEIPNLQHVYSKFGSDPRFTMISVSIDDDPATPAQYVATHGMPWTQAYGGKGWDVPAIHAFGVRAIPSIWLIGPDGRIVANELRGEDIEAAVAKALAR